MGRIVVQLLLQAVVLAKIGEAGHFVFLCETVTISNFVTMIGVDRKL